MGGQTMGAMGSKLRFNVILPAKQVGLNLRTEDLAIRMQAARPWSCDRAGFLQGATPLMRESMDRELQEVVKALEQVGTPG